MSVLEKNWIKHYPEEIPATIDYPDIPLTHFLDEAVKFNPYQNAVRFLGKRMNYKELYEEVISLAQALRNLGVEKGDRVSIMLPNCPQAVISYYAVLYAGGIVVQTNPLYVERELKHQLCDSGAKVIIALDLVYPRVAKVYKETKLEKIIITSVKDYLPFPKNLLYPLVQRKQGIKVNINYASNVVKFTSLIQHTKSTPPQVQLNPDDIAVLQYTGGTTGLPKGVMLTHKNLVVNTVQCTRWLHDSKYGKERLLAVVPFFHVYGMTVVMNFSIYLASSMILIPKFEVKDVLKAIDKEKPTLFPGAPTIYIALLNHPELEKYDLSSIRACISGSAALPVEVQQRFSEITRGNMVEGYGLTETSPVTHCNLIFGKKVSGSIGIPWPDTDAAVLSLETREAVGVGEIGEIAVKGPQVMKGYWQRPEETAKVFHDGWFLTGDVGYMDQDGFFYIVDRKKDMIIAGGFNIYPREIEEVLYEHEAVLECCVAGVPDAYRGETVKAFIVLKEDARVTEEALDRYCREKLAAYKVPRVYEFRKELPKSMIGKILRRVLIEEEQQKVEESNKSEKPEEQPE